MMLVVIVTLSGCAGVKNQGSAEQLPGPEKKTIYRDVMEAWTQEGRIYDGLLTQLISKVTFKSAVFRQAYTEEYSRLYNIEGWEYDKRVMQERKEAAKYHDFVMAAYVPEKKWDDFSKKTSMWKIYITRDHVEQIRPLEIRKLKKKDPLIDYFYPYVTTWKSIYHVRFPVFDPKSDSQPIGGTDDVLTLVMTSVIGSVEFKWETNQKQ
jgi:hypothetical protein